jgi:co-chaperonin GroES (HSP10)
MAQLKMHLNNLLIEEIPVENANALSDVVSPDGEALVTTDKTVQKPFLGKVIDCGDKFPIAGQWVDMPYRPGDVVFANEFGRDYLILDPFRDWKKIKKSDTQYYTIHYEDIIGVVREA